MACGHRVTSVSAEVADLLASPTRSSTVTPGAVTVTRTQPLDADSVRAAVDEAGYDMKEPA